VSVPTVFSPILPQDFTLTPIKVHKRYVIQRSDLYQSSTPLTGSGYKIWEAIYLGEPLKLQTRTYPTNSWDGTYQHIIWNFIDNRYYRNPYDSFATAEHANSRFTYKQLAISASILVIPQGDYGEGIKPGSVELTGSSVKLTDDKNGNLYDASINTGSFTPNTNLVAHWNFQDTYRTFTQSPSGSNRVESGIIPYVSHTFTPDTPSRAYNVGFSIGKLIMAATSSQIIGNSPTLVINQFNSARDSYVITDDRPEFNFYSNQDFSIAFWAYSSTSQGSILSKRGTVRKIEQTNIGPSQSYHDDPINVFPYDFSIDSGGFIHFKRSDGISTVDISASFNGANRPIHVCAVKTGSLCNFYVDGTLQSTQADRTRNPVNNHCLMFGNLSTVATGSGASTFLNDVRIYDKALSLSQIQTLSAANISAMQTAVVGNVFYKTGTIVINSPIPAYRNIINESFELKFHNTHTIYQYEILARIKKGAFNLTLNPSARINPQSDLLINDFTGSLFPYATTIGFYNDTGELMAVGKLSQPIQMRDDVDINIVTRMDV